MSLNPNTSNQSNTISSLGLLFLFNHHGCLKYINEALNYFWASGQNNNKECYSLRNKTKPSHAVTRPYNVERGKCGMFVVGVDQKLWRRSRDAKNNNLSIGRNNLKKSRRLPLETKKTITKTCLFKYTENFTTKKWKFSDKKFWFFIFLLKT